MRIQRWMAFPPGESLPAPPSPCTPPCTPAPPLQSTGKTVKSGKRVKSGKTHGTQIELWKLGETRGIYKIQKPKPSSPVPNHLFEIVNSSITWKYALFYGS